MKTLQILLLASIGVQAQGLSGWYVGQEGSTSFNPNSQVWSTTGSSSYYRFLPDGRVYWGWTLPKGVTMDDFDRKPDTSRVGNYGAYIIRGSRIMIKWAHDRSPDNLTFSRGQGYIAMGGTNYYAIAPCNNLRMSGTWGTSSYTITGKGNGVSGSNTIVFTPDGQFRSQGFVGSVNQGPSGVGTTSQTSAGVGTYRIAGNTLELTFAGGKREMHSFFLYPQEEQRLIVIDGAKYLNRGR